MTILFMGSDLTAFASTTGFSSEFTSVNFRGPMPFTGLGIRTANGIAEYSETPAWTAVQDIWLHAVNRHAGGDMYYFMDGANVAYKVAHDSGQYKLFFLSAPATYTQIGTAFTLDSEWQYFDINITTGASGQATVYVNDVQRMATGTVNLSAAPDITSVRLTGDNTNDQGGIVIADEPTIGWRLGRLPPLANGANTAWTGGVENIDETTLNVADYIYTGTAAQVETYTISTVPTDISGYIPRAVAVSAYARRGSSGPTGLQTALRSGGTDYFGATKTLGLGYGGQVSIWETNPDTGLAWTSSQLAALQIGVKSIA